jgi:hypothetical protein
MPLVACMLCSRGVVLIVGGPRKETDLRPAKSDLTAPLVFAIFAMGMTSLQQPQSMHFQLCRAALARPSGLFLCVLFFLSSDNATRRPYQGYPQKVQAFRTNLVCSVLRERNQPS